MAPSLRPLYEVLEITNTFTSFIFQFVAGSEAFCHAAIARLLSSIDEAQNHASTTTSRLMAFHQAKAMRLLRQEVDNATLPTNAMLATILYLVVNDVGCFMSSPWRNMLTLMQIEDGQPQSADIHRKHLTRLVKSRGGLNALGPDGFEKAMLMQYLLTSQHHDKC